MDAVSALGLGILPLLVIFFVLSLIKTSLRSLSKVTLRRLAAEAAPRVKHLLEGFLESPSEFVLHIQGLIQVSLIGIAVLATSAILAAGLRSPVAAALAVLGVAVLVFEHFFPRYVMSVDREKLLTRLLPAYGVLEPLAALVAWPVTKLYLAVFKARPGATAAGEPSQEEVRAFIDVGEEAGILDQAESEIVESLVDFGDTLVREVMTPRVDMVSIEVGRTVAELRDLFIESKHSRVPVYRERVDSIEGVVYIKDILEAWRDGKETEKVGAWMKPTVFVPDTKKVASLLKEFQRSRVTFAIVIDEYGGTSGLVTIEDLIEEIVGEIKDEYEEDAAGQVQKAADGSYLLSGKVEVEKIEELFDVAFDEADYETVAGLVFATLGRVPAAGEEFSWGDLRFRVVDADRRRVNKVRVARAGSKGELEAPPAEPKAGA